MNRLLDKPLHRGILRASGTALLLLSLTLGGVRADEVTDWNAHMVAAMQAAGPIPIVSSRDAAMVAAAVFDAVNGIEQRYEPIHVDMAAPRGASRRAAAVQAAYAILVRRFPTQEADLRAKRAASLDAIGDGGGGQSVARGVAWGQQVADEIWAWRGTDGFTMPLPPFLGGQEPGQWRPTPPAFAAGLLPQFATMTPWAIETPWQFRPDGPPALDSPRYLIDLEETRAMGAATSLLRTADQTQACRFWAAMTATYAWNRVARDLAAERGTDLSENARLMAMLNLAIADAAIACWDTKYAYSFWRPVTAIGLTDPLWAPLLVTPAFPEYSSAHTTTGSAAATVLAAHFGEDSRFALDTPAMPGVVRSFAGFPAAVAELADARVFAGIHFRTACEVARVTGEEVAVYVLGHSMRRLHGE
jgi:hypothetical protein